MQYLFETVPIKFIKAVPNRQKLLRSIFPIALENGSGYAWGTAGTAFVINFMGYKFILTAWHCIESIILKTKKYQITNKFQITNGMIRETIEDHVFFGIIKTQKQIYRIPINAFFVGRDKNGNFSDIIILKIDDKFDELTKNENCSLSDIEALELSSSELRQGDKYTLCGYPNCSSGPCDNRYIGLLECRTRVLKRILSTGSTESLLQDAELDYMDVDSHEVIVGCSGGPILDENERVIGMAYEARDDDKVIRFITSDSIEMVLKSCLVSPGN